MGKLFIPPLGTELTLAEPWTFNLFREYRNESLIEMLGVKYPECEEPWLRSAQSAAITLPAGSKLKVDRFYIKKGQGDFDSVTFYLKGERRPGYVNTYINWRGEPVSYKVPAKAVRFWAKLADVNNIVFAEGA